MLTWYPAPGAPAVGTRNLDLIIGGIPWPEINIAVFRIDRDHSNAYTAAGGSPGNPYPKPGRERLAEMRLAQEVALETPILRRVPVGDGIWRGSVQLEAFATVLVWITPWSQIVPEPPAMVDVRRLADRTEIGWTPSHDPQFHTYEVYRLDGPENGTRIGPDPLRAAFWTDDPIPPGTRYKIRTISTSGMASAFTVSN